MIASRATGARLFAWLLALALAAQLVLAPPIAMAMAAADAGLALPPAGLTFADCQGGADTSPGKGKGGHGGHASCLLCQGGFSALAAIAATPPVLVLPQGPAELVLLPLPSGRPHVLFTLYRSRAPPFTS